MVNEISVDNRQKSRNLLKESKEKLSEEKWFFLKKLIIKDPFISMIGEKLMCDFFKGINIKETILSFKNNKEESDDKIKIQALQDESILKVLHSEEITEIILSFKSSNKRLEALRGENILGKLNISSRVKIILSLDDNEKSEIFWGYREIIEEAVSAQIKIILLSFHNKKGKIPGILERDYVFSKLGKVGRFKIEEVLTAESNKNPQ